MSLSSLIQVHDEFRSHVYGFTWEDPVDDLRHLNLTKDDSMLVRLPSTPGS
jgi:hypothetical protein